MSYSRLLYPFILAASFLALLLWYGNNYVIPKSTETKAIFENTYIWKNNKKTLNENVHFFIGPEEKVFVRYFRLRDSTMIDFRVEKFENGKLVRLLKAKRLKYINATKKWQMRDYVLRNFDGLKEDIVVKKGVDLDTTFNFTPDDLIRYSNQMEMMSSRELLEYVEAEADKGISSSKKFLVEYHRRNADPFTIIILTLIGVSLASRKVRGGLGINLAIGLMLGSLFVIISKFSVTFAYGQTLSPFMGIWIPNIIFSIVAIFLLLKAQK